MNNLKKFTAAVLVLFIAFALPGCGKPDEFIAADDEIALQIKLNIKEDIGLLLVEYEANGSGGFGGISNADKSPLKRDDLIIYTFNERDFKNPSDAVNLSVQLTVITEYAEPNMENIYPSEYTKPMNFFSLKAEFGKSYFITISGDNSNGYKAVLEE